MKMKPQYKQPIAESRRIPSLRIAVTGDCNLRCSYCPVNGDNYLLHGRRLLDEKEFSHITLMANETGFRHFSITGGEPLTVPDTTFAVAETISKFQNLGYLRLNTNGLAVKDYADRIKDAGFHLIKISIDSLRTGKYQLPGSKGPAVDYVPNVLEGIEALKKRNIPIRINMVVGKYNTNEIAEMIDFCKVNELELKLFDITYYRDALANDPRFWRDNYFSLVPLSQKLQREFGAPKIVYSVGGFGNPMQVFKPDSLSPIRLRISENSAMYDDRCPSCPDYLCQDGFCNLTLTTEGDLKTCRPEGLDSDLSLVNPHGKLFPDNIIKEKFDRAIALFQEVIEKQRGLEEITESWKSH